MGTPQPLAPRRSCRCGVTFERCRQLLRRTALRVAARHRACRLAQNCWTGTRSPRRGCARSLSNSAMDRELLDICFSWLLPLVFQVVLLVVPVPLTVWPARQTRRTLRSGRRSSQADSRLSCHARICCKKFGLQLVPRLGTVMFNCVTRSGLRCLVDQYGGCLSLAAGAVTDGPTRDPFPWTRATQCG